MPLYTYECESCETLFEDVSQSIKDPPLRDCPKCNEPKLQRVIGQTSFVLRGGGWAKDRYGSTKRGKS